MLVMALKHESENSGMCAALPPVRECEPFLACPDPFRKAKRNGHATGHATVFIPPSTLMEIDFVSSCFPL